MNKIPKRAIRGNALDEDLRSWFMTHRSDDLWNQGIPPEEIEEEHKDLKKMNNTQFRKAFIEFYGKEWWDTEMAWQHQNHY